MTEEAETAERAATAKWDPKKEEKKKCATEGTANIAMARGARHRPVSKGPQCTRAMLRGTHLL